MKGTEGAKEEGTEARWFPAIGHRGTEVNWHQGLRPGGGGVHAVSAYWRLDPNGLVGEAQEVGLRNVP